MAEVEQRTMDWYKARLGHFTGSQVGKLLVKGRDKKSIGKTAYAYIYNILAERQLSKEVLDDDSMFGLFAQYLEEMDNTTKAMRIGIEREAEARALYSLMTDQKVEEVGSIEHPFLHTFSSSPDGVVKNDKGEIEGCCEFKCQQPNTYIQYQLFVHDNESLKEQNLDYYCQCQSHMMVTGAKWCDFAVYCKWQAEPIHITRIERDEATIDEIVKSVAEADKIIADLLKQRA